MKRWKVVGINFDHFHMGDNLQMAANHPQADVVGICDEKPERMAEAQRACDLSEDQVFTDYKDCLETCRPDIILLCPAAAEHGLWTERVADSGAHVLVEKPFAASVEEADRMLAAMARGGGRLAINWPMAWYPTNLTAHRLVTAGEIGEVREVHYYDGNRGPLWHTAGKAHRTADQVAAEKPTSWFYSREHGGGSLLDYLGYGSTLATWFHGGKRPVEVMCMVDEQPHLEVDEHAVAVVRYANGLSKLETRWGTFSDPWTHQPQPKCGFVIVGTAGTISSYDFEDHVTVQTKESPEGQRIPVDAIKPPLQDPIQYLIHCLEADIPLAGPLAPECSRMGQLMVDAAVTSSQTKACVRLEKGEAPQTSSKS